MIWLSSDFHFCHDRGFVYEPRGFKSVQEMNQAIIDRWNEVVKDDDIAYILGDIMLNDNDEGIRCLSQLKGELFIILGNHDTAIREDLYWRAPNVQGVTIAYRFKYHKHYFYLSHYPAMTANPSDKSPKQVTCSLFGHTHSKEKFYQDIPFMYNVAVDAHNCYPVSIDQIISDMEQKYYENRSML